MEGNLFFKIDRASLIVGSKFTVFALFSFLFGGNFPSTQAPGGGGASIWRGDLTDGFLRYWLGAGAHNPGLGGLYLEGAYTWRGLFSEFYGSSVLDLSGKSRRPSVY